MSVKGYGTRIAYGDESTFEASSSFTPFAKVIEITPPELSSDSIETSHLLTPGQIRTFMPSWGENSDVELVIEFSKEEARTVLDLFRVEKGFQIEFNDAPSPSGSKLFFDGWISAVGTEVDSEDRVTMPITIKVTGASEFEEAEEA